MRRVPRQGTADRRRRAAQVPLVGGGRKAAERDRGGRAAGRVPRRRATARRGRGRRGDPVRGARARASPTKRRSRGSPRGRRPAARRSGGGRSRRSSAAARGGGARTRSRPRRGPSCRSLPRGRGRGTSTRSSSARGSETSNARPAWRVSVWCAGPTRNASASSGSSASGSATPHQPNAARRPSRECAHACRYGAIRRPGRATPSTASVTWARAGRRADAGRRGEDEPANRVRTQRRGAERDDAAERVADPDGAARSPPRPRSRGRPRPARRRRALRAAARASVARQVGDEDAVARGERRRERAPVLDRPAQPVHEDEGERPSPADAQ